MRKLLLIILCTISSLRAGVDAYTTVLAKENNAEETRYTWVNKPLPVFVRQNKKIVITYCDGRNFFNKMWGDKPAWDWCQANAKNVKWNNIKNYYIITLQAPGQGEEDLHVTGDQLFKSTECKPTDQSDKDQAAKMASNYFDWVSAEKLYERFDSENPGCTSILRSPKVIAGQQTNDYIARIIAIVKMEEKNNQSHEFFDLTIDNEDNSYKIGKGQYWVKGI